MSQLPFSKYDAEFRKDHPETIGETDQTFDLSNYCEWLEKRVADRDALRAELERTKEELEMVLHRVRWVLARQNAGRSRARSTDADARLERSPGPP